MKKTNRKAFTIVELVIVIAVIAILAAVLIPTFAGIIESANRTADTQLVTNINTILAIEDIVGGGVNDAVEIQNVIKKNGLKLETKVKGQYLWYDIDAKRVVLGGLDENGIVLKDAPTGAKESAASAEANGASLVSDLAVAETSNLSKGKFRAIVNNPESFVNGYLFISTESADGFAQAISGLRNSESVGDIQDALADIGKINGTVGTKLTNFMKTVAVITSNGSVISTGDTSSVKTAIVSSELTHVKKSAITELAKYTGVQVVDFHSSVETFEDGVLAEIKAYSNIKFCYNSTGVEKIDKADEAETCVKNNLISPTERDELFKKLTLVYIDQNGVKFDEEKNIDNVAVSDDFITSFTFPYVIVDSNDIKTVYDFVAYSFYSDGSNPIPFGTTNYKIEDYDKILSDEESGVLTIYAVYKKQAADFKIGNNYYGSGAVTYKLANNGVATGDTITVVSTKAKLDASLIGKSTAELTIPGSVTLHLPHKASGSFSTSISAKTKNDLANGKYEDNFYKATSGGHTKLTVANGITLKNEGTVYVDAQLYAEGLAKKGFINSACGVLEVDGILNSTGTLYAYGVVRGSGEVIAKSGTVTEVITILDWHGGANAVDCIDKKVTPFNNWVADNIRAKMTINEGVKYSAFGIVDMTGGNQALTIVLVDGSDSSKPLFVMEEGSKIQKTYDTGFNLTILEGNVSDAKAEVSLKYKFIVEITKTIKFYETPMPLSNFDVVVNSGAKLTVSNNLYKVLPGSSITVDEGGTLNIETKVVAYNTFARKIDDNTNAYQGAFPYTTPAELIVKGTVNFNNGAKFAGEITGSEGAIINANVAVGGHTFAEGGKNGSTSRWVNYKIDGLHEATVMVGVNNSAGTLAAGTYVYGPYTQGNVTGTGWHVPTPETPDQTQQ